MGREEGVALSERALKLQTLAMISKLSALSKEEKLQVLLMALLVLFLL